MYYNFYCYCLCIFRIIQDCVRISNIFLQIHPLATVEGVPLHLKQNEILQLTSTEPYK